MIGAGDLPNMNEVGFNEKRSQGAWKMSLRLNQAIGGSHCGLRGIHLRFLMSGTHGNPKLQPEINADQCRFPTHVGNFLTKTLAFTASILKARSHGVLPVADSEEEVLLLLVPTTLIYSIFSEHNLNSY